MIFTLGNFISALSFNIGILLTERILQGASVAFAVPVALAWIKVIYPDESAGNHAMTI